MPSHPRSIAAAHKAAAAAATTLLLITGCSAGAAAPSYPEAHIHGMALQDNGKTVLLATHDGLYNINAESTENIGPTIDLMGFTTTGTPDHFYASGHPGAGSELPNPVGLIETTDGGQSWQPLSRQGQSDFHSLAHSQAGLVGFDGAVRTSEDEQSWSTANTGFQPADLSGTATANTVLATTQAGLQRSTDGGTTWAKVTDAPLLYLTDFASAQSAAGVSPDGTVYTTVDAGVSWQSAGSIDFEPHAMAATMGKDGQLTIWIATGQDILQSNDGGQTFSTWTGQ